MRDKFGPSTDGNGLPLNDFTLLRFLRARQFDVSKATLMLNNTLSWRREFDLKELRQGTSWTESIRKENSTGKLYVRGFDKDGSCLLYMKPRHENTNDHDGNLRHLVYNMERCIASMEKTKQEKLTLLIDFEGYNLLNAPPMKTSMATLHILQNQYPERLKCAYVLRAPWVFHGFWSMIAPFIDPVTKTKICMVSDENMKATLLATISPKVLEKEYGGDDERVFSSSAYLDGPFSKEYHSILED